MDALDAPLLLLSYSTDGIIPFEILRKRCEAYGRVHLAANPYVTYRGGRQSKGRQDRNLEFVLIVERGKTTRSRDKKEVARILLNRRLQLLLTDLFRPDCLRLHGKVENYSWEPELPSARISIPTRYLVKILQSPDITSFSDEDIRALIQILEACRCENREDELRVLRETWIQHPGECADLIRSIPRILKKMAHRKYKDEFEKNLEDFREIGRGNPVDFALIASQLERIENQARLRLRD